MEGRIVLGEESKALQEIMEHLLRENKKKIVLNMRGVTDIDSAGLGTLETALAKALAQGATLKLANLGSKFRELPQVTKLMTVFEVFSTEAAAVQSAVEEEKKTDKGDWPGPRAR
jgi:anti-anti-sigma factor